ncbi:chromosome segregation in meiosis protein 3 [[Candida] jaroonii]|uniref:Chromosome segregation in meiosis protein 3 n=1 Tax=[Candida] jaroonii TaxID=467808 RepID=A0ACA9Y0S9_9ASCO|nr:chromosome segregation in meiosis protein 3 [[Candida] jaroonii]
MSEDILQLDQQVKVVNRKKVAKLDQDRILGPKGLPYIVKNHQKLNRVLKKKHTSKSKIDNELQNLASVLQFYQLWCHTLFPKAKFKDCVSLIRGLTNRSPGLRIYRKELIEQEIMKLKVEQGLVDPEELQRQQEKIDEVLNDQNNDPAEEVVSDDDFMQPLRMARNNIFVDDEEEDLYTNAAVTAPSDPVSNTTAQAYEPIFSQEPDRPQLQDVEPTLESITPPNLDIIPPELESVNNTMNETNDDVYAEEEELMREMGM